VTDLRDLKQDIDNLGFATPPLHEIVDRARRGQRRRLRRRVSATTVLVAAVVLCSIVIVSRPGTREHEITGPGSQRYMGTATAAFVSKSGLVYVADQGNNFFVGTRSVFKARV
jgi:hypothetical protein